MIVLSCLPRNALSEAAHVSALGTDRRKSEIVQMNPHYDFPLHLAFELDASGNQNNYNSQHSCTPEPGV